MNDDFAAIKPLIDKETIDRRISELGKTIAEEYAGKNPLFLGIIRGAVIFLADLLRQIPYSCEYELLRASSYGNGKTSSGKPEFFGVSLSCCEGREVIVVEDIIDTGVTMSILKEEILKNNPRSLKLCSFLDKPSGRKTQTEIVPDYCAFEVGDFFIVGYGLDYAGKYRNLPYIGILS